MVEKTSCNINEIINMIAVEYSAAGYSEQWKAEKAKMKQLLTKVCDGLLEPNSYSIESCIAVAGSRVVFKIRSIGTNTDFALKLPRPLKNAIDFLINEYDVVKKFYHENLVRILFYELVTIAKDPIKYPVTIEEFIPDGLNLKKWLDKLPVNSTKDEYQLKLEELTEYIMQICQGVHFLHSNSIYHCDLKPENILISNGIAKIVDFGYSRRVVSGESNSNSKIGYSWDFALPKLKGTIESMQSRNTVFSPIKEGISFVRIDRYALGRTMEECTRSFRQHMIGKSSDDAVIDKRMNEVNRNLLYRIRYLELVAGRLKGIDSYEDSNDHKGMITEYDKKVVENISYVDHLIGLQIAISDLKRLSSKTLGEFAPEWETSNVSLIRIGPLDVAFTPRMRKLYNHPALGRLAGVTQLGLVSLVYPGAHHSRLEHSVGTFYFAMKYIKSLWEQDYDPFFRCVAFPNEVIAASLGALLHDLGQYPHAHDIEDSISSIRRHEEFSHEIYSREFQIGNVTYPSLEDLVRTEWNGAVASSVKKYLGKIRNNPTGDPITEILKDVISSTIDADKIDYLQRDSYYLGLSFASSIESEKLIQNIRPAIKLSNSNQSYLAALGVTSKGVLAAHNLIVAREHMFERVYWHKTVRAFKAMLSTALRRTLIKNKESIKQTISKRGFSKKGLETIINDCTTNPNWLAKKHDAYKFAESMHLEFSDYVFLSTIESKVDDPGSKLLLDHILERRPYKVLFELSYSNWKNLTDTRRLDRIIDELKKSFETDGGRSKDFESIRIAFQERLRQEYGFIPSSPQRKQLKKESYEVAILIDFPRISISDAIVNLVGDESKKEDEVDLSTMFKGSKQGWISSLSPRIYINSELTLERGILLENDALRLLNESI